MNLVSYPVLELLFHIPLQFPQLAHFYSLSILWRMLIFQNKVYNACSGEIADDFSIFCAVLSMIVTYDEYSLRAISCHQKQKLVHSADLATILWKYWTFLCHGKIYSNPSAPYCDNNTIASFQQNCVSRSINTVCSSVKPSVSSFQLLS